MVVYFPLQALLNKFQGNKGTLERYLEDYYPELTFEIDWDDDVIEIDGDSVELESFSNHMKDEAPLYGDIDLMFEIEFRDEDLDDVMETEEDE
jgi:hypothetical protein